MPKKITIKDVALRAGVSVSAVSRVYNNYGDISDATRKRVLRAAKELDYVPNHAARQLSQKQKKIIALVLNDLNSTRGVTLPMEILNGVINQVDKTDYEFVFYAVTTEKQRQNSLKNFCRERNISGLIIQGLKTTDPYYQELEGFELPAVAVDLDIHNPRISTVTTDNQGAAQEVVERLLAAGKNNLLFVNGTKHTSVSVEREQGVRAILPDVDVIYADFLEEKAHDKILAISQAELENYQGIFVASDLMAIGILKALKERRFPLPVVGFDDIALAEYITPSLTTVKQDIDKITEYAVRDLISCIESGKTMKRFVPYKIIVRESAEI